MVQSLKFDSVNANLFAGISQQKNAMKRKVVLLVPMVENLPGGSATKPGDIIKAMNGMTIKVWRTQEHSQ